MLLRERHIPPLTHKHIQNNLARVCVCGKCLIFYLSFVLIFQIVEQGKNAKSYHYILANLVRNQRLFISGTNELLLVYLNFVSKDFFLILLVSHFKKEISRNECWLQTFAQYCTSLHPYLKWICIVYKFDFKLSVVYCQFNLCVYLKELSGFILIPAVAQLGPTCPPIRATISEVEKVT